MTRRVGLDSYSSESLQRPPNVRPSQVFVYLFMLTH